MVSIAVTRVEVHTAKISVELREAGAEPKTIQIPWRKPPFKRRRELLAPESGNRQDPRPIRADARARLIAALSRGRRWLDEMLRGSAKCIEEIADREGCSPRKVNMTLSLAFLAPRDRQGGDRWTATSRRRDFPPFVRFGG
jgi:site-specific DNA recombinase